MIRELINFTNDLDSTLKAIGMTPKEGLHILLSIEEIDGLAVVSKLPKEYAVYSKKDKEISAFLQNCESLRQATWMIDTNKCIDNITRAIHSCSPFCLAIKRTNFVGGKNYNERKKDGKTLVYGSLESYFSKTAGLIEDETLAQYAILFKEALNSEQKIHDYFVQIPEYEKLKDDASTYIIFYLDLDIENYKSTYKNYFTDELIFNSNVIQTENGWYGASGFFNGFPTKKPFLSHQSASFDIAGRISAQDARTLFEFESIAGRKILPNPLPIFIYDDERNSDDPNKENFDNSVQLFKENALESGRKFGYKEIIEQLQAKLSPNKDLGNYYLLFYQGGEIKDFDFVSKFDYDLKDNEGENWQVHDIFGESSIFYLSNVFEFERNLLPVIFNNALVVKTKTDSTLFKYFDDIDAQYCKTANTYLSVMTYRKALYDFIYKSNRTSFTQTAFEDVLLKSILDDIRLDKYENKRHSEDFNIRKKLNILFSLYTNFQPFKQKSQFMANQISELRKFMDDLAEDTTNITTDEQFAFVAGQVIYYILDKSKSEDKSYSRLEPFLQLTDGERLKQNILKIFNTYKHEFFSWRFSNPFAQVMGYKTMSNLKDFMPLVLAGYFSKNQLFKKATADKPEETTEF